MGWRSVAWGLAHISSQELNEWEAIMLLEPTGFMIDNLRHGTEMSLHANINRDPDKDDVFLPEDFMYDYMKLSEEQSDTSPEHRVKAETAKEKAKSEQMKSIAQFWTIAKGN